jgi:hypothetical protein
VERSGGQRDVTELGEKRGEILAAVPLSPIFTPRPPDAPAPARIQPWTYVGDTVADLSEGAIRGIAEGWMRCQKRCSRNSSASRAG